MATMYGKWHHVLPIKNWIWLNLIDACGNPLKCTSISLYLALSVCLSLSVFYRSNLFKTILNIFNDSLFYTLVFFLLLFYGFVHCLQLSICHRSNLTKFREFEECSKCNSFNTIWTTGVARISSGMSVRKVHVSNFGDCIPSGSAVAVAAAADAYHTSTGWCWAWASLEPGRVWKNACASLIVPPVRRRLPPCGDPANSTSFPLAWWVKLVWSDRCLCFIPGC